MPSYSFVHKLRNQEEVPGPWERCLAKAMLLQALVEHAREIEEKLEGSGVEWVLM